MPAGWDKTRRRILRKSDVCYLCGSPGSDEVDHVRPRHLGGGEDDNLAPVHRSCHARKSSAEGHARKRALRAARFRPAERHPGKGGKDAR
jgi:5-methylcytosine-specific restriction endonuclease McrA